MQGGQGLKICLTSLMKRVWHQLPGLLAEGSLESGTQAGGRMDAITLLMCAASCGNVEALQLLLAAGTLLSMLP